MRADSLTGYLRTLELPNVRVQDALKTKLLCDECEQRLSRWESNVAKGVFGALHKNPDSAIRYDGDFSRFVISVLWRVLIWRAEEFLFVSPEFDDHVRVAKRDWSRFLLDQAKTPAGSFHAVILGEKMIVGVGSKVTTASDQFQEYLKQTIDVNVISDGRDVYAYAKLGRLLIFGFLQTPQDSYRASRIRLQTGALAPGAYQLPDGIFIALMQHAKSVFSSLGSLSERQRQKIDNSILRGMISRGDFPTRH